MSQPDQLVASYGRGGGSRRPSRRTTLLLALAGVALLVVATGFVFWSSLRTRPFIRWQVTGFTILDARTTQVRFVVRKPADREALCRVVAQDIDSRVVGEEVVRVPAGSASTRVATSVTTTSRPVLGTVDDCRVLAAGAG